MWKWLNIRNTTPLHYATTGRAKEIVEKLLSKGVDVNIKDIIYLNLIILFLIINLLYYI